MQTKDYFVHMTAADAQIRAFAVTGREMVETARKAHHTSPLATAALGRLLCGTVMMGADMLKEADDLITVQIDGDGPLRGLLATADCRGHVKGYVKNPWVILPNNEQGHLNVGGGVGNGILSVIRDMGRADPYSGQVAIQTGEIAEDLTYYFAASEQIPSSVGLGVLVDRAGQVMEAGGYIIQLMPAATEETIDRLEQNLLSLPSVTELLHSGRTPETILEEALEGLTPVSLERQEVSFYCNCDRDRVARALKLLGRKELDDILRDGEDVELRCHFCGKRYQFPIAEIEQLRREIDTELSPEQHT
ncbi:MAG: Hsp33 family molecular chaperone HslO [Butyrivibrio sp.]|nr:Hsp33 family molecular chaperone HslO [Butyrivibrio sp.]